MQILRCSEQRLFQRSCGWYYGATQNAASVADRMYEQYTRTKQYPAFVVAFSQAVCRNGGSNMN
jgi:hypothetical protein